MNVSSLIKQHPLLTADLQNLGLNNRTLNVVADDISAQLGGNRSPNLCYVLSTLSCGEFVQAVDTTKIADEANISPAIAQAIVQTIAPWVDNFQLRDV